MSDLREIEICSLFDECIARGFDTFQINRSLGELAAVEKLLFSESQSGVVFVDLMDIDPLSQGLDMWTALRPVEDYRRTQEKAPAAT